MSAHLSSGTVELLEEEYDSQIQSLLETLQSPKNAISPSAQRELKNHVSNMYSVFVQAIGKTAEHQITISRNDALIAHLTKQCEDARIFRDVVETKLATQLDTIQDAIESDDAVSSTLIQEVRETLQSVEDATVWQQRIERLAQENEDLFDKNAELQNELMDTQFSNQSLKTELCGRIQQLQLMSKGLTSPSDKMYQRVLHEMEQNSMKAYAQHGRKTGSTPAQTPRPSSAQNTQNPETPTTRQSPLRPQHKPKPSPALKEKPKYRRFVKISKGENGLGLTISGGVMNGIQYPVQILGVEAGQPAAESGQVYVNDWIVEACGKSTSGLNHAGLVGLLKSAGDTVSFVLLSHHKAKIPTDVQMCAIDGFSPDDVGRSVRTESGFFGTIRFVGHHAIDRNGDPRPRIGIELNTRNGKNDGVVEGYRYFKCEPGFGLLTAASRVKFVETSTFLTSKDGEADAGSATSTESAVLVDSSGQNTGGSNIVQQLGDISMTQNSTQSGDTETQHQDESPTKSAVLEPEAIPDQKEAFKQREVSPAAYSPMSNSKYSMGFGMDVASVQQSELREDSTLFSTM